MKLFYKSGACSLASHIALRESGLDFTLQGVDVMKKRLENGDDYLLVNPKGQVPALLLDDDVLLTEGVAIMQYIADRVPDRQLLAPVGSIARYQTLEWLNYVATELHKGHRFTIADGYLFTVLRWAYAVKLDMAGYSNIAVWMKRVAARPAVAAALEAEGLK